MFELRIGSTMDAGFYHNLFGAFLPAMLVVYAERKNALTLDLAKGIIVIHCVLQELSMVISLRLDHQLARKITNLAKAQGLSKSALIRKCLDRLLAEEAQSPSSWDLGKDLFGCYKSGRGDLSACAAEIARKRIHAKRSRRS